MGWGPERLVILGVRVVVYEPTFESLRRKGTYVRIGISVVKGVTM